MPNAEQSVIDAINELEHDDELVNWQLSRPWHERSGYDNDINQETCTLCANEWHGLPDDWCPGAYATEDQRQKFTERQERSTAEQDQRRKAIVDLAGRPRRRNRSWDGYASQGLLQQIPTTWHITQGSSSATVTWSDTFACSWTAPIPAEDAEDWTPMGRLLTLDSVEVRELPDLPTLITWNGTPLTRDQYRVLTDAEPPPNTGPLAQLQEHAAERPLSFGESLTVFGRTVNEINRLQGPVQFRVGRRVRRR